MTAAVLDRDELNWFDDRTDGAYERYVPTVQWPISQRLFRGVLDGVVSGDAPILLDRWRPGFLSPWLHAVSAHPDEWTFRDQPLQWSACGALVLKADTGVGRARCPRCSELIVVDPTQGGTA